MAVANWVRSLSSTERDQYVVPPHVRMGENGLEYYGPRHIPFWPLESHSALITLLANAYLELRLRTSWAAIAGDHRTNRSDQSVRYRRCTSAF